MTATDKITTKWTSILNGTHLTMNKGGVRCFRVDADGDGEEELCLQHDEQVFLVKGQRVTEERSDRLLTLVQVGNRRLLAEVRGSRLRLFDKGDPLWERRLAPRRIGLGFGRDETDDMEINLDEYFGIYSEKFHVGALEALDTTGDGTPELMVFTSIGRLLVYDLEGELLWSKRLMKGSFSNATFIPVTNGGGEPTTTLLLSCLCRYRRKLWLWSKFEYEPVSFVIEGTEVRDRRWELMVSHSIPGTCNEFESSRGEHIVLKNSKLIVKSMDDSDPFSSPGTSEVARDPTRLSRVLQLKVDENSPSIVVSIPGQGPIWAHHLESEGGRISIEHAVLGPEASCADGMVAVHYAVSRDLPEYNTEITEYRMVVLDREGDVVATHEFPTNNEDGKHSSGMVLDDIDGDGEVEVLVITHEKILVFRVPVERPGADGIPGFDSYSDLPRYELPPENLWSFNLMSLPASGDLSEVTS